MAERKINTRILLKHDTTENWAKSGEGTGANLVLKAGELAFDSDKKYIKFGDGVKTYAQLDYIHISASNVDGLDNANTDTHYKLQVSDNQLSISILSADKNETEWATVDTYELKDWTQAIADAEAEAISSANSYTDTQVQTLSNVVTADIKVLSGAIDDITKDAGELENRVSALESDVTTLKGDAETEGSVLNSIKEAIDALDAEAVEVGAGKTIKTISQSNGIISVETEDIQITQDQVTGLDAALSTATENAKDYADETFIKLNDVVDPTGHPVSETNKVITQNDIKDLMGVMHFRGAVTPVEGESDIEAIARTITDAKAGDVVIVTTSSKEYVYANDVWNELGDEKLYETKADAEAKLSNAKQYTDDKISGLTEDLTKDIDDLSTAIDQKVWIKDPASSDAEFQSGKYSDLSVVKITAEEYAQKVKAGVNLDSNTLYIVSSDYIDAYGQVMKNLANPVDEQDAATKSYVDSKVGTAVQDVKVAGTTVVDSDGVANLSALALKDKVGATELTEALSAEIAAKAENADLEELSGKFEVVETNYLSGVTINNVSAVVTDHVAIFDGVVWDCGSSTENIA